MKVRVSDRLQKILADPGATKDLLSHFVNRRKNPTVVKVAGKRYAVRSPKPSRRSA